MVQTDAWGDMREVLARAREDHGNLPCFDAIEALACVVQAANQADQYALDAILAIATDRLITSGLLEYGADGVPRHRSQRVDVDEPIVVDIAG